MTVLVFLGICVDTVAGELQLPDSKLERLKVLLRDWGNKIVCRRKELESLISLLNHACKVVRPGRSFIRHLIDLLHQTGSRPSGDSWIILNSACRADLAWWTKLVEMWNGKSFLQLTHFLPTVELTTDSSGTWGCGAWYKQSWFQVSWDHRADEFSIATKELIPIVLAGEVWRLGWHGSRMKCKCDNQVVVAALRTHAIRDLGVSHLLRGLIFIEATLGCRLIGEYIDTVQCSELEIWHNAAI